MMLISVDRQEGNIETIKKTLLQLIADLLGHYISVPDSNLYHHPLPAHWITTNSESGSVALGGIVVAVQFIS